MKRGVFNMTPKQNERAFSGKHRIHLSRKNHTSGPQVKTMLVCFFNHKGIVHYEFIAQGKTVNQQCYLEVLTRLRCTPFSSFMWKRARGTSNNKINNK